MTRRGYAPSCSSALLTILCLALCSLGFSGNAGASTWTVNTTADSNDGSCGSTCSLRDAITAANADSGDIIQFSASVTGTITLASALPAITANMTITGPGAASLTVSGNNSATVGTIFTIESGTVSISDLTIANGVGSCGGSSNDRGGGICIFAGTITLNNIAVINNSGNVGGGIYNQGTLTVTNSTFSGNSATVDDGGGIENDAGTLTVTNSTFSANTAVNVAGGIATNNTTTLTNVTLSGNSANTGGGVYIYSGTVTLANTIAAGNTAPSSGDIAGTFTDGGGNLIGTSGISLAPLGNYGGPTQTMLPLPSSPAICAGNKTGAPATDQRGFTTGAATYCTSGKIDSGAVQTDYTVVNFTNPSLTLPGYAALVDQSVAFPAAPIVSVTENGLNQGGVPVTLTFNGSGTASGLGPVTTVAGTGATFSSISVTQAGSDTLGVTLNIVGSTNLTTSADLKIVSITMTPAAGALPGATENRPYTATFSPSGGTTATYTFNESGTLPTGLTFASTTSSATVSGTPTQTGNFSFSITATDGNSFAGSQSYTLAVNSPVTATQAISSVTLTANHAPTPFTPVTATGGTAPLTYSISPSLPSGLSISSSTGAISGTPTAASAANSYTVTVTDVNGSTDNKSFALTVNGAVAAMQSVATTVLTANHAASFTPVTGSGGTTPLSYSISPALPTGLSISSSTGTITGTPTTASAQKTYTVTVTDANSATATANFMLTVNGAVTATLAVPTTTLTANHAASFTPVTGSGGTTPLVYSVSPALPSGLNINSGTGAITGTPTTASAAANYTVTVTDANTASATATFSLTVNTGVTATQAVAATVLTASHPATSFTPVTGSGGTTPLVYSVSPGLPAGLGINSSTGTISGTPTGPSAATTYTVTVTDANSATATASFTLTVNSAVTATRTIASTSLTVSQAAASFTPVTGSGGTAPLVYGISPALPSGLSISSTTGLITGTPTAASVAANYTVTVTDANTATASASFSLTVNSAVTATATTPVTLTVNQPASFTPVTGSGGTAPLAYSISPSLPTGLSLNSSTGAITGTDTTVSAATSYTVTVTDANQVSATGSFMLTVNQATTSVSVASSSSGSTSNVNGSVTFTAQVTPYNGTMPITPPFPGTAAIVTGTVTFEDNGSPLCSAVQVALVNGLYEATCSSSSLLASSSPHTILATYSGNSNYSGSNSSLTQTVKPDGTSTVITSSLNPSIVSNIKGYNDQVVLTATVTPANSGSVPLSSSGTVTFTDNNNPLTCSSTTWTVSNSRGVATCTTIFQSSGQHSIAASYANDPNFTGSASTPLTQEVQGYTLIASVTGPITITQGFTNTTDPFSPQPVTVTAQSLFGFTGSVTLACTAAPITAPSGAVPPACTSSAALPITSSGGGPVPITIDAGSGSASPASPGLYQITVTGVDSMTGLIATTQSFSVNVIYRSQSAAVAITSGTSGTGSVTFQLPAGVGLSSFQCPTVGGPTLASTVAASSLFLSCTQFNPSSVASSTSMQTASVSVTVNTNGATTAKLDEKGMGGTIVVAGLLGIPILVLLGFMPGGKSSRKIFLRYLAIAFVLVTVLQGVGCGGGSFTRQNNSNINTTPVGQYYLLVQSKGTDGNTYEAVLNLAVTR